MVLGSSSRLAPRAVPLPPTLPALPRLSSPLPLPPPAARGAPAAAGGGAPAASAPAPGSAATASSGAGAAGALSAFHMTSAFFTSRQVVGIMNTNNRMSVMYDGSSTLMMEPGVEEGRREAGVGGGRGGAWGRWALRGGPGGNVAACERVPGRTPSSKRAPAGRRPCAALIA